MNRKFEIETTGINYNYSGDVRTLDGINLQVEKGSVYGFLGPNGSGKTTTLSLLLGLLHVQEGNVEIFGKNIRHHRVDILRKVGALVEKPSLYGHLSARENLEIYRRIYYASKPKIDEVLGIVGLSETGSKSVRKFSLGMTQRLSIALALLPSPEVLILDEPTNGLDPTGIIELRQLIGKLNQEHGMTILVSSHILAEVEKMATHVGIIAAGKMLFQGTLKELFFLQKLQTKLQIRTSDNDAAMAFLSEYPLQKDADMLVMPFVEQEEIAQINRLLVNRGLDVYLLRPTEHNLEQLFIDLTTNKK
ncbi:MAG: ATP-binding cassette domain-containing protein [Gemmatimonadaceae bacterium]|nr:ATP-binding cassette domain-containing protein [Chitinophagaceae bacterium]